MAKNSDVQYMSLALELAKKGLGKTWPNPMVGAVVVKNNKIIGQGWHKRYGTDHAEVMALKQAGLHAKDATLYVTLEPCSHYGKTPPCVNRIISAKVKKVIAAMQDPNPKVAGQGFKLLKQANIDVEKGLLGKEAHELNRVFLKTIKTGLPYIISKAAMTMDGKIADSQGQSKWITGEQARKKGHYLRQISQAIIIGGGTAIVDDPQLTARNKKMPSLDQPIRVVIEGKRMVSSTSQLVKSSRYYPLVIITPKPVNKHKLYQHPHLQLWSFPKTNQQVDIKAVLEHFTSLGISLIMIEGGSAIQATFFGTTKGQSINYVDEVYWFMAPKVFGGINSLPVIGGDCGLNPQSAINIMIKDISPIGDDWLLQGMTDR